MDISKEKSLPELESFVLAFCEDRVKEIEAITKPLGKDDLEELKALAHKWKGYSRPYGFIFLEKLSIDLENAIAKNITQNIEDIFDEIKIYLFKKKEYILDNK